MYELHAACRAGNVPLITKLLAAGHNLDEKDEKGFTPMFHAICADQFKAVACLIEHITESTPDANAQIASQLIFIAKLLLASNKTRSAANAFDAAVKYFELLENRTDDNTRLYMECLQSKIEQLKELTDSEIINVTNKILAAYLSLREKNELDHLLACYSWHNLGETWRVTGKVDKAKAAYLNSIKLFPRFNDKAGDIITRGPGTYTGLSDCFKPNSFDQRFYRFAANCLRPGPQVASKITELFNAIIQDEKANPALCNTAVSLINTLLHLYDIDVLNNKSLRDYFSDEANLQLLKNFRSILELKQKPCGNRDCASLLFAKIKITPDSMSDNLPPENIEKTHWSTFIS